MSLILLGLLLHSVDLDRVSQYLKQLPLWYFVAASALHAGILILATVRWWLLIPGGSLWRLLLIGFGSQHIAFLLPSSITTDAIRLYATKGDRGGIGRSLVVVFWDKVSGFAALLICLGVSTWFVKFPNFDINRDSQAYLALIANSVGLLMVCAVLTPFGPQILVGLAIRIVKIFPLLQRRLPNVIGSIRESSIDLSKMKLRIQLNLFLAFAYQMLVACGYLLIATVFNQHVTLPQAIWASSAMQVLMLVPLGIAGLGLKDVSLVAVLGLLGFSSEVALSASLAGYPVVVVFALGGWLISGLSAEQNR